MHKWRVLTKITDPIAAALLEGRLRAEGIPVISRTGEAAGSLYGLTTGPLAEIMLLVPLSQLDEAKGILAEIEKVGINMEMEDED